MSIDMLEFFSKSQIDGISRGRHPETCPELVRGLVQGGFTDSRNFRSTELTTKSSLGKNPVAGQECPAYRVFEI
jgi:hypothetical protein